MKKREVTLVRVYLTEGDHQLRKLLSFLHQDELGEGSDCVSRHRRFRSIR